MAADYSEFLDYTAQELYDDWLDFVQTRDPLLKDTSIYTFNSVMAEAVATQFYIFIQLLAQKVQEANILTATGTALSALVLDRLPEGRYDGTKSEGIVKFSRTSAAPVDIVIPVGVKVAARDESTGALVTFLTTSEATIATGETVAYAYAESEIAGDDQNISAAAISFILSPVVGVTSVTNEAAFTGGTDFESDDDLRSRYLYTIWIPGRATVPMMMEHVDAVEGVREVKVATLGEGDVLIVVDAEEDIDDDIEDEIYDNLAAGCTAPGVLGATLRSAGHTFEIGDCAGASVWIRCRQYVGTETLISFGYQDTDDTAQTGTCTIPAGTAMGEAIETELSGELALYITSCSYAGALEFDVYMGRGTYPYLWVPPELQEADVTMTVTLTSTPETDLLANIQASLEAALNDYHIGDQLEFADVVKYAYIDYDTGRAFRGVDDIETFSVTCKESTIDAFGAEVAIDSDERVMAGTVSVTEA